MVGLKVGFISKCKYLNLIRTFQIHPARKKVIHIILMIYQYNNKCDPSYRKIHYKGR